MKYIKYEFENGYAGCEETGVEVFNDSDTNEYIHDSLRELLYDYGDSYEWVADIDYESEYTEDEIDNYYDGLFMHYEEISEQEYLTFLNRR